MSRQTGVRIGIAAALCLLVPISAFAIQKPRPEDRVLPDFDSRVITPGRAAVPANVRAALDQLRRPLPQPLSVRFHPLTGAVRLLTRQQGKLTPPSSDPPETIARRFLSTYRDLFALTAADLGNLTKTREYSSFNENLTHLWFEQRTNGIRVFEGAIGVHLDRSGSIVWISNNAAFSAAASTSVQLTAEQAVQIAAADIRPELNIAPQLRSGPSGSERRMSFDRGPFNSDISARLVYFPTRTSLKLAWHIMLEPTGFPQKYEILVDAADSSILYRRNTYLYADGVGGVVQSNATLALDPRMPDEHPLGSNPSGPNDPAGGCPPMTDFFTRSLNTQFRDPLTVLSDTGRLAGNSTHVFRSTAGTEGALGTSTGGVWHFDFGFNTAESAETFLFFVTNFTHDFFYDLGFDEAAGNFQVNNFGRGGVGGDSLNANARAPGRDNANFQPTIVDGETPAMNMFLWDGSGSCWAQDVDGDGSQDLDGDYDSDIIIHEYHHGVTFRLNPSWTGDEAGAIGEGGGDFFAYSLSGDTKLADYAYPPTGIREVNAKTYADWFCFFGFFCEPHDNGQIWANVLWDLRERFRTDLVGGSGQAGINELHRLYIDGLKLSPAAPTMLEMRDAMLQADFLRNASADPGGSVNYCRMWSEFAKRGMGVNAEDTKDTGNNSVVDNSAVPAGCPGLPAPPTVTVDASDPTATEAGLTTGMFTYTRTGNPDAVLTVHYSVSGTATAGSDYAALSGAVTFAGGSSTSTLLVTPVDDQLVENDETVTVTLQANAAYQAGRPASATVTIVSDDVAPDLTVSALFAPTPTGAGATITLTDTTMNQGAGAAGASTTRFYLSKNTALDTDDVTLGERAVPALATSATSPGSTPVTIPPGTTTGTYYVIAKADAAAAVAEAQEGNNTKLVAIQIGPDLIVSALTGPATAGAGTAITITDTTKNQGGGSAGASATRFVLSADATIDASDFLLGIRQVPSLLAGDVSTLSTQFTIPATVPTGNYYVIAKADADAAVVETAEGNNTKLAWIQIGPDLIVSALSGPAVAGADSTVTLTDTTKNQGAGDAVGATSTRFYLSANFTWEATDLLLNGSREVSALAAGASSSGSTQVTIPAGTATGTYYIIAKADGNGALAETVETNNTRSLSVQIGPDLVMSALSVPVIGGAGYPLTITDTTKNQGSGTAAASTTRFYLSTNYTLDPSDVALGSRAVPPLAAGATSSNSVSLIIPQGTANGTVYIIAKADDDAVVGETVEGNNTKFTTTQLGPDLVVSAFTVPASGVAGQTISVTDTTKNQGGGDAGPSMTTRFYLSTNFTLDAGDVLLDGSRTVLTLTPGAISSGPTVLTIPQGTAPRYYYLIAKADADAVLGETVETNNTIFRFISVQ